jgi:hypothetical protein
MVHPMTDGLPENHRATFAEDGCTARLSKTSKE